MTITVGNMAELTMAISDCCEKLETAQNDLTAYLMTTELAIGAAMDNCCTAEQRAVQVPVHEYTPPVLDAQGNVTTPASWGIVNQTIEPASQAGAIVNSLHECQTTVAAIQTQDAQWQSWFQDFQDWRNLQIIPQLLALGASIIQFQEYNAEYKNYVTCSNEVLDEIKIVIGCLSAEYQANKNGFSDKIAAIAGQEATIIQDVEDKYATWCDGEWQQEVRDLFFLDGGGPNMQGAGYATLQRSHVQNIGTHLAQICTDGRDASGLLLDKIEGFLAGGGTGDKYEELECKLIDLADEDSLASQLVEMLAKAQAVCQELQDCGKALQDNYTDNVQADYTSLIGNLIECADGGVIDDMKANTQCVEDELVAAKQEYLNSYAQLHEPGCNSDLAIQSLKQLYEGDGITSVRDCIDYFKDMADGRQEMIDRYLGTLSADASSGEFCLGRVIIDQACGLVKNADGGIQALDLLGTECYDYYKQVYADGEDCFATTLFTEACDLATCLTALNQWFKDNRDDILDCYEEGYGDEKAAMACLMDDAQLLCDKHSANYTWLCDCAIDLKENLWANCYRPGEEGLAKDALQQAIDYIANQDTDYAFLRNAADLTWLCWDQDYREEQKQLDQQLHDKAQALVQCVCDAHDFLCEKAEKHYEHYCNFWLDKERQYVCDIFDCAIQLAKESYECLDKICDVADEYLDYFRECYQDAECITAPKLILAAERACAKNEDTYAELCRHEEEMYEKWADHFCGCDIEDLERVCAIYEKVDPICEIHEDAECAQDMADRLKECYYDLILPWEKEYIERICDYTPYEAQFCEVEDRALLAIRLTFGHRRDDIRRCANKYNKGLVEKQLADSYRDQAKAEAAAIQSANRHEKWWAAQEEHRLHGYALDMMRQGASYPDRALAAYQQSTQAYDIILGRLQQRIERGYVYLQNSQAYSERVLNAVAGAVGAGINTINAGHFWPDFYRATTDTYLNHSNQRLGFANDMMRIGQDHMNAASNDKNAASNIALGAIDRGQQATQNGFSLLNCAKNFQQEADQVTSNAIANGFAAVDRGHVVLRQAIDAKVAADGVVSQSMQELLGAVDRGHFWQNAATQNADLSGQLISRTMDDGLFLTDKGHRLKQMALDAEAQQASLATSFVNTGLQAIDRGHWWIDQQQSDKMNAASEFHQGTAETLSFIDRGLAQLRHVLDQANSAHNMLQTAASNGLQAGSQALAEFNAANGKMTAALEAGMRAADQAMSLSVQGNAREQQMCENLIRQMQMVPSVANAFTGLASQGNSMMAAGMAHEKELARCSLERLNHYCDMQAQYQNYLTGSIGGLGTSVFGQAFQAAQHFQYLADSALNDFVGVTTSIFATPPSPFNGVFGFGGQGIVGSGNP